MKRVLRPLGTQAREAAAYKRAAEICEEDDEINQSDRPARPVIIRDIARKAGRARECLTHCNAGWLATVDWGTATAPIYRRMTRASRPMSGSTKRGRATRALTDGLGTGQHGVAAHRHHR